MQKYQTKPNQINIMQTRICIQDIRMEFVIEKCVMLIMGSGKTNNWTAKSRKNQNARKLGNLEVFGILGAETIKQTDMKQKVKKRITQTSKINSGNPALQQEPHQGNKHLDSTPWKIFGTILEMHEGVTLKNEIEGKKRCTRPYIRDEEEDSPVLKIEWTHQYENVKTTLKRAKKDQLQRREKVLIT